jgi:pimeloyl-ACP methyl ester carboxylesterase
MASIETVERPLRNTAVARRSVGLDGQRVSYLTAAPSPATTDETVLLIHGAGMSARSWREQIGGLGHVLRVVAVDLPGHGDSDPTAEATVESYAEVARRVLDALGTGPVVVIGHSLGGAVALVLAARHPKLLKGLVLVSSCAKLPRTDGAPETLFWLLPGPIRKVVFLAMTHVFFALDAMAKKILFAPGASMEAVQLGIEEIRTCRPETILKDAAAARAMDLENLARGLAAPVLVLCGERDRLTPLALSERLRELIPDARLRLVAAAGHMLPMEAPQQVNGAILEFVRSCMAAGAPPPGPAGSEKRQSIVRRLLDQARAVLMSRLRGRAVESGRQNSSR